MVAVTFFSMVAPPGTRKGAVEYAHRHFSAALQVPEVQQMFAAQGATPGGWTPERTGEFIRNESAKWSRVIKSANVTVE